MLSTFVEWIREAAPIVYAVGSIATLAGVFAHFMYLRVFLDRLSSLQRQVNEMRSELSER